ncbi:MAG: hypothetical protein ACI8RN_002621 [Glaciecola sp.]|jgi:hypothetical protein
MAATAAVLRKKCRREFGCMVVALISVKKEANHVTPFFLISEAQLAHAAPKHNVLHEKTQHILKLDTP